MGQIEDLNAFATIVETGSISKAAEAMNIAKSALSRRLALLEARYDAVLIKRAHGEWHVTPHGQALYERARGVLADIDELNRDFGQDTRSASGPLAVTLPREFGLTRLTPFLTKFAAKNPQISLQLDFDDHLSDLAHDNYDLAVRITPNAPDGDAEWIGQGIATLWASTDYIKAHGEPDSFTALKHHQLLHYGAMRGAHLVNPNNAKEIIEFRPRLASNAGLYLARACADGLGIAMIPDFVLGVDTKPMPLHPILADQIRVVLNIYIIQNPSRRLNNRMRQFGDELAAFLQDN